MIHMNPPSSAGGAIALPEARGQRLVRAKNKIRQAGIPLRVPAREGLRERLDAVLDAIYAGFAETLDALSGDARLAE